MVSSAGSMRVVSWNLWWRFGAHWRRRERGILSTLEGLQADVVGLQEVWAADGTSQGEVLAGQLGMHCAFGAPSLPPPPVPPESPDQEGVAMGVAVLSRWPVLDVDRHRLPSAHRAEPVALLATLGHPGGPLRVMAACVEWEPEFVEDHLAQTRALARLLVDPSLDGPLPVVLTADLNAAPETPQIQTLTDVMVDTWIAGGGDPDGVTLSSKNPFAPPEARQQIDRRIDYVLVRPGTADQRVAVPRAFVADGLVGDLYSSDHYAVVADLTF
jgi:endonuclease/exonuclease/phosphatase family metal-dependent hydrolase